MSKKNPSHYTIGYKKPPHHTQFKPGQSGNVNGRPKKAKQIPEVVNKEFRAFVTLVEENGKRRKISKLEALVKHYINKGLKGDLKAAALVLNLLRLHQYEEVDNLFTLVEQFRARNNLLQAAGQNRAQTTDEDESSKPTDDEGSGTSEAGS
jgi:hypothetical protein